MSEVIFSICHTTARPREWRDTYEAFLRSAVRPENVEYVLCVDERWGFDRLPQNIRPVDKAVWNTGRKCLVDGANIAAANSLGKVLLINSDDFFPCDRWDEKLLRVIQDLEDDFVIRTSPGPRYQAWLDRFVREGRDAIISRLMTFQILSRTRYQRFGYALYPEFTSMMADTDFTDSAECDGVVIEAPHIEIEHRHPFVTGMGQDRVSEHENQTAAHELGARIYQRRHAERRGGNVPARPRKKIAVLCPGDDSGFRWKSAWSGLLTYLATHFDLAVHFNYCSNQYFVRDFGYQFLLKYMNDTGWGPPDYVLMIDSDNIFDSVGFEHLLQALENIPEISGIGGWYWMGIIPPAICARVREPNGDIRSITIEEMQAAYDKEKILECTDHLGFGFILIRWEVFLSDGTVWPFRAMVEPESVVADKAERAVATGRAELPAPVRKLLGQMNEWSGDAPMKGDDVSFCRRAIARGHRFFVHPEVYLPHIKKADIAAPALKQRETKVQEVSLSNAAD